MKRRYLCFFVFVLLLLFSVIFASCSNKNGLQNDANTNNGKILGQIPVYQGMSISSTKDATTSSEDDSWDNGKYKVDNPEDGFDGGHWIIENLVNVWVDKHGNKYWRLSDGRLHHRHHPGCQHGDYDGRNDEIDVEEVIEDNLEEIEEKVESTLDVIGALEEIYYATLNQDIYITIHISNPSAYEILSFVLNGAKYTSYMFENGSDLEHLILKVNAGNVPGIKDYTIDEIKYIDGTEIKDVLMDGDKTVKTGVYTDNMVSATISNEEVTLTTLSYNVSFSDNYNLVEKSGGFIKTYLYDGENIIEKEINKGNNTISFEGLTPNTLYPYAVVAYYDDLTGNNDLGADVHILESGAMYTNTIVLFKDIVATQTSISWDYEWEETFTNKTITALALYKGEEKIRDLDSTAKTAEGLLSNNQYKVVATYKNIQNEDENIMILVTTNAKVVPTLEINNTVSTQTNFTYEINVTDTDSVGSITKIELLHGEDDPINVDDLTSREFTGLLSNNEYTVKVTYTYDLNDGNGTQTIVKSASITTIAKAVPTLEINNIVPTQTSFTYSISVTDTDSVGALTKIELLYGNDNPINVDDLTSREFAGLLSNNEYSVRVTYSYDLNDDIGAQTLVKIASVTTNAKVVPVLEISNANVTESTITANYDVLDIDGICTIESVQLQKGNNIIETNAQNEILFTELESYTLYKIIISYRYDLNDGTGVVHDMVEKSLKTNPFFEFTNCKIANTSAVSEGDTIYMSVSLTNPSNALPQNVIINGKKYNCTNTSTSKKIFVEIINNGQFNGGNTVLTIEKVDLLLDDNIYSVVPNTNNSDNIFINGKLEIISVDYVNSAHEPILWCFPKDSISVMLTLNNPTGYFITNIQASITGGTITIAPSKIDDNHYIVPISNDYWGGWSSFSLASLDYSNEYISKTINTNISSSCFIVCSDEIKYVSTPEDLMNMGANYYYEQTCDIDLNGIEWSNPGSCFGVFDGKGYSIKNMSFVGTIKNSSASLGLFSQGKGLINNINIKNELFIVDHWNEDGQYYSLLVGSIVAYNFDDILYINNCSIDEDSVIDIKTHNSSSMDNCIIGGIVASAQNCYVNNCVNNATIYGNNNVGGISGSGAVITNCINNGTISGNNEIGGINGLNAVITNCINNGTISGNSIIGGISGSGAVITNCINNGTLSGNEEIGGISGIARQKIISCINNGDVTGDQTVGGIVGHGENAIINCSNNGRISANTNYVGGISGTNYVEVSKCTNSGSVMGNIYVGGIIGSGDGMVQNCINTGDITGADNIAGIMGYLSGTSRVEKCINCGSVISSYGTWIVGFISGNIIIDSCIDFVEIVQPAFVTYYDVQINNQFFYNNDTSAMMNTKDFYLNILGFDESIWDLDDIDIPNGKYPKLRIEES